MTRRGPLPQDAILLHLGFHKTGTTALQSAFAASRPALLEHGVLYPGRRRSHHPAAMAMTGRTWGVGPRRAAGTRTRRTGTGWPARPAPSGPGAHLQRELRPDRGTTRPRGWWRTWDPTGCTSCSRCVRSPRCSARRGSSTSSPAGRSPTSEWLEQIVAELEPGARRSGFWLRNDYPTIVGPLGGPGRCRSGCIWCAWTRADRGYVTAHLPRAARPAGGQPSTAGRGLQPVDDRGRGGAAARAERGERRLGLADLPADHPCGRERRRWSRSRTPVRTRRRSAPRRRSWPAWPGTVGPSARASSSLIGRGRCHGDLRVARRGA